MAESGVIKSTASVGYEVNHNTEAGLTEAQKRTLSMQEEAIRQKKDEELVVIDDQGHVVGHDFGNGSSVSVSAQTKRNTKDNIVTHNHPAAIGKKGVRSIGNAMSTADIRQAVGDDAREIRAVTPRYTFSMKRPANGWGMTREQAATLMQRAEASIKRKNREWLNSMDQWDDVRAERAGATHWDEVNKLFVKLAKKEYGVDIVYRHRRVH